MTKFPKTFIVIVAIIFFSCAVKNALAQNLEGTWNLVEVQQLTNVTYPGGRQQSEWLSDDWDDHWEYGEWEELFQMVFRANGSGKQNTLNEDIHMIVTSSSGDTPPLNFTWRVQNRNNLTINVSIEDNLASIREHIGDCEYFDWTLRRIREIFSSRTYTIEQISNSTLILKHVGASVLGFPGIQKRLRFVKNERQSTIENIGSVGSVSKDIVVDGGSFWMARFDTMSNAERMEEMRFFATEDAERGSRNSSELVGVALEKFGHGYYRLSNIKTIHLSDINQGRYHGRPRGWDPPPTFRVRVTADVIHERITAPAELSHTGDTVTVNISIRNANMRKIALVRNNEDARNLFFDRMMAEALKQDSNAIDVINIRVSGDTVTGQLLKRR